MNKEYIVEEIITEFLLDTCRERPQLSIATVDAALCCAYMSTDHRMRYDAEADTIPLITGSAAEFYIEPMLPHIGDIDMMYHYSANLAIPQGHPPPTQLPAEFHKYVKVFEIIDSHLPGYVYLQYRYLLNECIEGSKYNAVECDRDIYYQNRNDSVAASDIHGPAVIAMFLDLGSMLSVDAVHCVRCLIWPPQAAGWPTRRRNYGWPDSETLDHVVSNGCDIVGVAHRLCRQNKWMNMNQWRLSFSRAEIVLLNSWMPVQQIVYHVLRVFIKTERLTESADNSETSTLSNYHIKTLMLWACELKPKIWWTDDVNLVRICVELLHDLAVWLTQAQCPHHFISACNLVDITFNLEAIWSRLMALDKPSFSSWFVKKYIRKCSSFCPGNVGWLFDDVTSSVKLRNAVSAVVNCRRNTPTMFALWEAFDYAKYQILFHVSTRSLTVRSLCSLFIDLPKMSTSLPDYFVSVAFLHVAQKISRNDLNDKLMDVLAVAVGQSIGPGRYSTRNNSCLLVSKTVNLMKAVNDRNKLHNTVQLIEIELSKAYLYRALRCEDSDSDSIYCLANVYLAVLYFRTGQYQRAIDHCTLLRRSHDHSQCSMHVVQGELLPKIDDDIDTILGLAVFYKHVRTTAWNQQQRQSYVTAFTTEVFGHYLHIKCLSVTRCQQLSDITISQSATCEVQSYTKYITDMQQLFVADILLCKFLNGFYGNIFVHSEQPVCAQYPTKYPDELNTTNLVQLLQKSAVEHLTTFRQIEARDFGSLATIVTTDFGALYAYKLGDYRQCLQLSKQNVRALLNAHYMPDVYVFPEFIQLMDDDIVSLTALTLIVNRNRGNDSRTKCITQLTLSLYLMTQCQLKLRHSVTSLAQTLDYITVVHRRHPVSNTLDGLVLKMTALKALTYITSAASRPSSYCE